MKRWIVMRLEDLCELLRHPWRCRLAEWSERLDARWDTGLWKESE